MTRVAFRRELSRLNRKQRGTTEAVEAILDDIAANGLPSTAMQIPGLGGRPVFKLRIPVGRQGRRACRLIVHYEDGTVEPLFIYAKNDRANIEPVEIREALRAAGLIGESESN